MQSLIQEIKYIRKYDAIKEITENKIVFPV